MSNSYGIIKAPISIDDAASALGVETYDLGTLCTHQNVNKWSFRKPVEMNTPYELSEADYYSIDDGFTITNYSYPSQIVRALAAGDGWVYNKPTSYYRLTDFIEYNHSTAPWFTLSIDGKDYGSSGDTIRFTLATDLSWLIDNFSMFKELAGNIQGGVIDVGFIVSNKWSSDASLLGTYYYKIADYLDFRDNSEKALQIVIPTSYSIPNGRYYVIPVITTYTNAIAKTMSYISENNSQARGTWFTIPANPVTINIDQNKPQFQPLDYIYISYSDVSYDEGQQTSPPYDYYKNVSFTAECGIKADFPGSAGDVVIQFIVENVYQGTGTSTYDKTIGSLSGNSVGKGWKTTKFISSGKMMFLSSKEDGYIAINVDVQFKYGTKTYKQRRNITLP